VAQKPNRGRERYLTYRLDIVSTEAIRIANDIYTRDCGLGVRQLRVLRLVDDNPGITFSDLIEETRFERSLVSRLLNELLQEGLIERTNSETDARVFHLRTTKSGQKRRDVATRIGQKLEPHLLKPLTEAQRTALFDAIDVLTDWVYGDFARSFQNGDVKERG
jgi:DNA-binding MarR family transcriptional regulator